MLYSEHHQPTSPDELVTRVSGIVVRCAELGQAATGISAHTNLWDAGMDSMSIVRIVVAIEDEFELEFAQDLLVRNTFDSIDSISTAVAKMLDGARERR